MQNHWVFGVRVDDLSTDQLGRLLSDWLEGAGTKTIVTPNPEFVLKARGDAEFRARLVDADLSLPDGVGLRFAVSALTDGTLAHRHTGVDTLELLARACAERGKSLVLLGGDPGVAKRAANRLEERFPGLSAEGIDPGRVPDDPLLLDASIDDREALFHLQSVDVIAVGLGQGKQERVMQLLREQLGGRVKILIGVGGAFDMIAGTKRRSPAWMRRAGIEWVWRLAIEPSRWRRIWNAFPVFPAAVIWDTLKHRRFLRACRKTIPEILRQFTGL